MYVNGIFPSRFCIGLIAVYGSAWLAVAGDSAAGVGSPAMSTFAAHLAELARKVPEGFTVVPQPPFVVIGDERPAVVRLRATNTVKWAVDRLKQDYFKRDPLAVTDIWLFKDESSYTNHARLTSSGPLPQNLRHRFL